jgi:hypothetical protein
MKNIFVLPTDKPSRLYEFGGEYHLQIKSQENFRSQHIYITNSEKIKEGQWCLYLNWAPYLVGQSADNYTNPKVKQKIILTTDQDLIKDGVQAIDDEFLEWFIKNPSCVFVEINNVIDATEGLYKLKYKIIIPKEEPKQELNFYEKLKEYFENTPREKVLEDWNKSAHLNNVGPTVDEFIENSNEERLKDVAERFYSEQSKTYENAIEPTFDDSRYLVTGFIDGVKSDIARDYWFEKFQKEVEDKTLHAMISIMQEYSIIDEASVLQFHKEWIEQNKKK